MDVHKDYINVTWRYSNPDDGSAVWLKLFVEEHNQIIFWKTVDARKEFINIEGKFELDLEYGLLAKILEGTSTETQLPILALADGELIMRNDKLCTKSNLQMPNLLRERKY